MAKQASGKAKTKPDKRNRQNQRTFANVTKRRLKHAKAHGTTLEAVNRGAKTWVSVPTAKSTGKL